jgi:hypothetical protein
MRCRIQIGVMVTYLGNGSENVALQDEQRQR